MADLALDQSALDQLLETIGGDREFLAELIDTYLGDSPRLFGELRDGLAAGDATTVRRAAHTLKSTSASLGANRLAATCRDIESAAGSGDLAGLAARAELAQGEFEGVAVALRAVDGVGNRGSDGT